MIKSKAITLFFALVVVFVTSCHIENNSDLDDSIKELQTNQKNIQEKMLVLNDIQTNQVNLLKKIQTIEKSISTPLFSLSILSELRCSLRIFFKLSGDNFSPSIGVN